MSKGSQTTNTTSTTDPNAEVQSNTNNILGSSTSGNGIMGTYDANGNLAQMPVFSYQDQSLGAPQVAQLNGYDEAALGTVANAPGYQGNYSAAEGIAGNGPSYADAGQTAVGAFGGPNGVSQFENPYQNTVIGQGIANLTRGEDQLEQQHNSDAASAGAFGGSRAALQQGEDDYNFGQTLNNYVGTQEQAGYNAATNQYNQTVGNDINLANANNAAETQGINNQLGLASAGDTLAQQEAQMQQGAGNLIQNNEQQILNAGVNTLQQQFAEPVNLAQQLEGINQAGSSTLPYSTSGTSVASGASPYSNILGAGIGALGNSFGANGAFGTNGALGSAAKGATTAAAI